MEFVKKKLTLRRKYLIETTIGIICRIVFKFWLMVCIALIFAELGIGYTIWTKIVSWFISLYASNKLWDWLLTKVYVMIWPKDAKEFIDDYIEYSELRDLFDIIKQLIFYTTDEKKSS